MTQSALPESRPSPEARGGFFTVYKSGQGYWTRMLTGAGVALITVLLIHFLYTRIPAYFAPLFTPAADQADAQAVREATIQGERTAHIVAISVCAVTFLLVSFFAWRTMNKPANAEFLIATDSEMKKVNWTSRAELIGSTKVVIFFMFLIALVLFVIDIIFGYFFYMITVLKAPPL
jgi:preprotein translocase subunit SecE